MSYSVKFLERNYKREGLHLPCHPVVKHPLTSMTVTEGKMTRTLHDDPTSKTVPTTNTSKQTNQQSAPIDPLLASAAVNDPLLSGPLDPLSQISAQLNTATASSLHRTPAFNPSLDSPLHSQYHTSGGGGTSDSLLANNDDSDALSGLNIEPWSARRTTILSRYTTSEKLSIVSSFLVAQAGDSIRVVASHRRGGGDESVMDKVKSRLEQLDNFEEGSVKETSNLSQQEFIEKIQELQNALQDSWNQDQRVKTLQIVIQCTKLLSDVSAVQFYPSKFVLITDLLDTFGSLVYSRLKAKSAGSIRGSKTVVPLPDNFKPSQVPEAAKETARNWFYKIASIRELMPRLFVETALLKSYRFLDPGEITRALDRIMHSCRGVADPLVASYARCYVARMGILLTPLNKGYLSAAFNDFIATSIGHSSSAVKKVVKAAGIDMPAYMTLYSPALDWLLQCLIAGAPNDQLEMFLNQCKETNNALLINSALSSFPPQYISAQAEIFTGLISQLDESGYPRHLLCQQLGNCLVFSEPAEALRLPVLNGIWQMVTATVNPREYLACADAWAEFIAKHFGRKQVNFFFGDVIKHVTPDRAYESLYTLLQSVLNKVMVHIQDFQVLFDSEQFLRYLDLFEKEHIKLEVYKSILEAFLRQQQQTTTSDPVLIEACLSLARQMHDSLHSLSVEDERRAVSRLVVGFITLVDLGEQLDRQLDFYVQCRASMANLDLVLVHLVHRVNRLAMRAHSVRRGAHTTKTASFVRACVAYSFITIPSLSDWSIKIKLYLSTAQVALINGCLGQADSCYKTAITLLLDAKKAASESTLILASTPSSIGVGGRVDEAFIIDFAANMTSSLLMTPDNVGQGCLYLLKGLLNALQAFPWGVNSDGKYMAFLKVLNLVAGLSQPRYLYHAGTVDANDRLYGNDPVFLAELAGISSTLVAEILAQMKAVEGTRRGDLASHLLDFLVHHGDLRDPDTGMLAGNLWGLVTGRTGKAQASTPLQQALLASLTAKAKQENFPGAGIVAQMIAGRDK